METGVLQLQARQVDISFRRFKRLGPY